MPLQWVPRLPAGRCWLHQINHDVTTISTDQSHSRFQNAGAHPLSTRREKCLFVYLTIWSDWTAVHCLSVCLYIHVCASTLDLNPYLPSIFLITFIHSLIESVHFPPAWQGQTQSLHHHYIITTQSLHHSYDSLQGRVCETIVRALWRIATYIICKQLVELRACY